MDDEKELLPEEETITPLLTRINKDEISNLRWELDKLKNDVSSSSTSSDTNSGLKFGHPGSTGATTASSNTLYAMRSIAARSGSVASAIMQLSSVNAFNMKAAIYSDNAGVPGDLLTEAPAIAIAAADDNYQVRFVFNTPIDVVAGTVYWFAFLQDTAMGIYYAFGSSQNCKYKSAEAYADGFDNPWPGTTGNSYCWTHMVF